MKQTAPLGIRLLGTVRATRGDAPCRLSGRRQRALLALLALSAGEVVRAETVGQRVWDGGGTRANVQTAIARLRRALGPDVIDTERDGYRLAVERDQVDVVDLLDRFEQAKGTGSAAAERDALATALADWRTEPFGGEDLSDWFSSIETPRLQELHLRAVERRIQLDLELGDHGRNAVELRELTAAHPLRESLWVLRIKVLAAEGRNAEALATYESVRRLLADELGTDPSPDLQAMHQQLLHPDDTPPGSPGAPVAVAPQARRIPRQLPADLATFSGRGEALAALDRLLPDDQDATKSGALAVVHGPGGIGKSSLAVHWGRRVADRFPDGQLFVNLRGFGPGPVTTPTAAQEFMLRSIGVSGTDIPADDEERAALIRSVLDSRRMLIVLDDAHDADQVRPLLPGGPSTVVVTSRRQLPGLAISTGATRIALEPMSDTEAVAFLQHRMGDPAGSASADDLSELADLCGHLPIALAVAAERAGRAGVGGATMLVNRLRDEQRRLSELSPGDDQVTSVRAVFASTYTGLDTNTAILFQVLSVHPNAPISTGAAAALAGCTDTGVEGYLDQLLECHLLRATGPGWFEMHQLARDFAAEHVDTDTARAAHLRLVSWAVHSANLSCIALDDEPAVIETGPLVPGVTVQPIDSAADALTWFAGHRALLTRLMHSAEESGAHEHAFRIVPRLARYLSRIGSSDGLSVCELGLRCGRAMGDDQAIMAAANNLGIAHGQRGAYHKAMAYFELGLEHAQEDDDILSLETNIGLALDGMGRTDEAIVAFEKLVAEHADGSSEPILTTLNNLANSYQHAGRHEEGLKTAQWLEQLATDLDDPTHRALAPDAMGTIYLKLDQPEEACSAFARALKLTRETGKLTSVVRLIRELGVAHLAAGRPERARVEWQRALDMIDTVGLSDTVEISRADVERLLADLPPPPHHPNA